MKELLRSILIVLTIAVIAIALTEISKPSYAGGDQNQGDVGIGEVVQNGPCPFGGDTPAGPLSE